MTAFEYLSVLLSVILGLAVTQVLQGYRGLLLARGTVEWHGPALIWSVLVLLFATQAWWASFGLEDRREWDFATFLVILLQMALVYLLAAVVLPDVPDGASLHLGSHFEAQRRPFFACLGAIVVVSVVKDLMLDGRLPGAANLGFHALLAATAVAGFLVRSPRLQLALAVGNALLFGLYVALLFARL